MVHECASRVVRRITPNGEPRIRRSAERRCAAARIWVLIRLCRGEAGDEFQSPARDMANRPTDLGALHAAQPIRSRVSAYEDAINRRDSAAVATPLHNR
jgi:hypothetical protein